MQQALSDFSGADSSLGPAEGTKVARQETRRRQAATVHLDTSRKQEEGGDSKPFRQARDSNVAVYVTSRRIRKLGEDDHQDMRTCFDGGQRC